MEVGGVGYRVLVSPTCAVSVGDVSEEVFVWVHHHIREDTQTLYGFRTLDERRCFAALLGAHGVGPSVALGILSVHGPADLARILATDDVAALCLVPKIGRKTAARLLVELKSRLDLPLDVSTGDARAGDTPAGASPNAPGISVRADVRDALAGLGYGGDEIRTVLADLPDDDDAGVLLKAALQRLATTR